MSTIDHNTTDIPNAPIGYDGEGNPMFERDWLDAQYDDLMDRMKVGTDKSWFTVDQAVNELLEPTGALPFAEEVLELLTDMVKRERARVRIVVAEQELRLEELRRGLPD